MTIHPSRKCLRVPTAFVFIWISVFSQGFAQKLPSPEDFFGFKVGADYHLLNYQQALDYWKKLETLSPRIKLFEYGKSSYGRPMIFAAISSEDNMSRLDIYKNISKRLSLVRGLSGEEAQGLASEGKAIVWIDGGLHATEVAPAQHIIQLTYDLLSDSSRNVQEILNNVIALLVLPNPDGMDMVAEWYQQNLNTPYETSPLPWLYQKYIGHDNNRDSFMLSVPETRNINRVVNQEWYPHIFYNHHQSSPFPSLIFVPPDCEPTNPNLPPLLLRWQNYIGAAIAKAFESEGKEGVISRFLFDTWYPGYVTQVCDFHNIISTFSETFLYHYATPHFYTVRDFPEEYKDFTISMFYTNPWNGGWWRLRFAVEYCLTASKAVLSLAAKHREELLHAKYAMGKETIERYAKTPPYGWIIPQEQKDPEAAARLVDMLIALDLDVFQAAEPFQADGIDYGKGVYILPTSQPFGRLLKTLFEIQVYPDLRRYPSLWQSIVRPIELKVPPLRTYDVLGWTLPLQMGVKTTTMNSPVRVKMEKISRAAPRPGKILGDGNHAYLIPYESENSVVVVNRILKSGANLFRARSPFTAEGRAFSSGTLIVPVSGYPQKTMKLLADEFSLQVTRIGNPLSVKTDKLRLPRAALYKPWMANMDEGWTELVMDNHDFSYQTITDAEIRAGSLEDRFDVIILPHQDPGSTINGHSQGTMPPAYVGGISASGVRNLRAFVENGGTLVAMGSSCDLAIEQFKLPVTNILKSLKPEEFFGSGLLVKITFDQNHPIALGMPEEAAGFFANSPTFEIFPSHSQEGQNRPEIVGKYADDNVVLSGWMLGEEYLKNKAAVLRVTLGRGNVILLGFRVQHRGQTVGTFKLLFNSIFSSILK